MQVEVDTLPINEEEQNGAMKEFDAGVTRQGLDEHNGVARRD